jgi:hypothetical protein
VVVRILFLEVREKLLLEVFLETEASASEVKNANPFIHKSVFNIRNDSLPFFISSDIQRCNLNLVKNCIVT